MWYLIVSIPDLCTLTYFNRYTIKVSYIMHFWNYRHLKLCNVIGQYTFQAVKWMCFRHSPIWCPGSGVVFDCLDSWYLCFCLLCLFNVYICSHWAWELCVGFFPLEIIFLKKKRRESCMLNFDCVWSSSRFVSLPHDAMGGSVVCSCGIFWSYSLAFSMTNNIIL